MIRVHVICEGPTEEKFVKELLASHFAGRRIFVTPALLGKPGHKGGRVQFDRIFTDVRNFLRKDTTAYCTTFIDYFKLPTDFPGRTEAVRKGNIKDKAQCITDGLTHALKVKLGSGVLRRFIPYVQMHEFEALLFSDPAKLAEGIVKPSLVGDFEAIRKGYASPEEINDSPHSAPSYRIKKLVAGYDKPTHGVLAALEVGLDEMRRECELFNSWIETLENLK